jgi:REP element-mobilizing transposase RayT
MTERSVGKQPIPIRDLRTYGASRAVRHPDCDYAGDVGIHLTICAVAGEPFRTEAVAHLVADSVETCSRLLDYRLYGYCLMPDHLHVLLSPARSGVAMAEWLRRFKGFTSKEYGKLGGKPPLWQRSAYDHVCREGETAERVLAYIADNPVRAKLVENWRDWPWTRVFIEI